MSAGAQAIDQQNQVLCEHLQCLVRSQQLDLQHRPGLRPLPKVARIAAKPHPAAQHAVPSHRVKAQGNQRFFWV